jgi:hypothetical protein
MPTDPLTALAAADPAEALSPLSGDQIATQRLDVPTPLVTSPVRSTRRRRARPFLVATAVIGVVASGAVAGGVHPWQRDASRQAGPETANEVFQREYAQAQGALRLPPGVRWPARSIGPDTAIGIGRGGQGESTAVVIALSAWQCFAVDSRGPARAAALAELTNLIENHVVSVPAGTPEDGAAPSDLPGPIAQFADDGREQQLRQVRQAERGDISGLAQFCRANSATP